MNKLRLPKKVRIGCIDFSVLYPYGFVEDFSAMGLHNYRKACIRVSKRGPSGDYDKQSIIATFLHEVVHGIDNYYTCGNLEETTVDRISYAILQVLTDNDLCLYTEEVPKKLKIGPLTYKVVYPYDFTENDNFVCDIDHEKLIMRLGDNSYSPQYIKSNLVYLVFISILTAYCFDKDELEDTNTKTFSNGLYQVMKDNKLGELVDKWMSAE